MKAFRIEASDSIEIVDKFNEVGNNFAISSTSIGEALQRSASALASAGNTLEESIGLITAANAIVQNPQSVGTAMKTLTMYLRAAKTDLEDAGESSEGCAESVSKLREQLQDLTGVDIMLDEHTFKSTYQIIKEISEVWDRLSDATQANVTGLIAGKRNANVVQALMTNFQDAENAMQTAMNSSGSAFMENEKYLDSIAGKVDVLKGQFQAFSNSVLGSGVVKFFVDLASNILGVVTALNKVHLLLPAITGASFMIIGRGMVSDVAKLVPQFTALAASEKSASDVMSILSAQTLGLSMSQKKLFITQLKALVSSKQITQEYLDQVAAILGLTIAEDGLVTANNAVSASFGTMMAAIGPIGWISIAISGLLTVVQLLAPAFGKAEQEAIESAKNIIDAYDNAEKTYNSNIKTLNGLKDRFEELSEGVDSQGQNVNLTKSEYEEYRNILQQIIDISPGVVSSYDDEGAHLRTYKDVLSEAVEEQKTFIEQQKDIRFSASDELYKGAVASFDKARKDIFVAANELARVAGKTPETYETIRSIIEEMGGIDQNLLDPGAFYETAAGDLVKLYERREEFLGRLKEYTKVDEEGNTIFPFGDAQEYKDGLRNMAAAYQEYITAGSGLAGYAQEYVKDIDAYNQIPIEAIDELNDGLALLFDGTKSINEYRADILSFGNAYADAINIANDEGIIKSAHSLYDGVDDGREELENYNKTVDAFLDKYKDFPLLYNALSSFLFGFTDNVNAAKTTMDDTTQSVIGLKEALSQLKSGYDILAKARADIFENGGLSNDTIKSIQDALEENEKLTDYLKVENGQVKLNEEAWEKRTEAIARGDIEAKRAELRVLDRKNNALIAGSETGNAKQIEENWKRIQELNAEIEIYNAALASAPEDPMNLSTMFSNLSKVKGDASTLLDALDDLGEGHLQNWAELVTKFPELMELNGLFDIDTIEGQQAALSSVLSKYEEQFDSILLERAQALSMLRGDELAAGHDVSAIDTIIRNIARLRSMSLVDIVKGVGSETDSVADSLDKLSNAVSNAQSAQGVLDDIVSGEKSDIELLKEVIDLAKKAERPLDDFIAGVQDGEIQYRTDRIDAWVDVFIDDIRKLEEANPEKFAGITDIVKQMIGDGDVTDPLDRLKDSLGEIEKIINMISDVTENGVSLDTMQTLMDLFGEKWENYIRRDSSGNPIGLMTESLRAFILGELDAQEVSGGLRSIITQMIDDAVNGFDDAKTAVEGLSDAVSNLQSALDLRNSILTGSGDPLEILDKLFAIAKENEDIKLTDLIQFGEDGGFDFSKSEAALNAYIDSLLDYDALVKEFPDLAKLPGGEQFVESLRNAIKAEVIAGQKTDDLKNSLDALSSALSNAGNAGQILNDIAGGEKTDLEIFQDVISLAEAAGEDAWKFISSFSKDGGIQWNTEALEEARASFLATIQAFEDAHPEFDGITEYIKGLTDAAEEAKTFSDAMSNVNNTIDLVREAAKNGITLDTFEKARELFGTDWQAYFNYDEAGNAISLNTDKAYEFISSQVEAGEMTAQEAELIRQSWENAAKGIDDATDSFGKLTDAISGVQSVTRLLNDIDSGNGSFVDMLNSVIDIARNSNLDLSQLLTFDNGIIDFDRKAIAGYLGGLFSYEKLKDVPGMTEDIAAAIRDLVRSETEAERATEDFNNALGNIGKARGVIENIRSGDTGIVSMLQTASEMATLSGGSFADFFTTVGGELKWSEEAVTRWAETWIQSLEGVEGITPEILAGLREYVTSITGAQDAYTGASEGINHVFDAIKNSVSELGVNNEQMTQLADRYKDLAGYSPEKLFEKTSMGVHLNVVELERLEDAYQQQERAGHEADLQRLQQEYKSLTEQIANTTDATAREKLFADRQEVADKISALHTLASQYDALTSKYNMWKQAQSMGEEGDMYDDIAGSLENIKKLYDEGLIGTNKFRKAVQLMTNEDLTGKSAQELKEIYEDRFPNLERYFKEGKEAGKGIDDLFSDIEKAGERVGKTWAWKDEEGGWQFQADDLDEVAEEIGISGELLEMALRKVPDLGGQIDLTGYGEGINKFAGDAESAIEEIENSKKELDESFANGEIDTQEYVDAWGTLDRYQKKLKEIRGSGGGEAEKPISIDEAMDQIEQLKTAVETMTGLGIEIPVTITGDIEMLEKIIAGGLLPEATPEEEVQIPAEIIPKLDEYDTFDPMDIPARLVPEEEPEIPDIEVGVTPKIKQEEPTSSSVKDEEVTVKYNTDTSEPDDYDPENEDAQVVYGVNDDAVDSYSPSDKNADVNYTPDFTEVLTATAPELKGKVKYSADASGIGTATGTANARGTAYKNGNGALKNDVFALSGELGPELVVLMPRRIAICVKSDLSNCWNTLKLCIPQRSGE